MEIPTRWRYTPPMGSRSGHTQAPSAGRWSAGDRGREPASAVGLPAAGLGPAWSSRRKKGGDPVTYSPTVICEEVPSQGEPGSSVAGSPEGDPGSTEPRQLPRFTGGTGRRGRTAGAGPFVPPPRPPGRAGGP